jgi:FkbM family methyltransferase
VTATESVRLSALARPLVIHEVPQLGAAPDVPIACDADDPAGLRRVVEFQARELVRLRRALVSAEAAAAQRLILLQREAERERVASIATLREEVLRVERDIHAMLTLSRWRRLGLRLGLAKRMSWEDENWRSRIAASALADLSRDDPSISEASVGDWRADLQRLRELRDDLARSRWRNLGLRLGLAKRLGWETEGAPSPCGSDEVRPLSQFNVIAATSPSSYDGFIEFTTRRFLEECKNFGVDVIFDVGANAGQFGKQVRQNGYRGHIVSFEPLSDAHRELTRVASQDPLWDIVDRCAVGAEAGSAVINVAANSYSSSILPMLDSHKEAAPGSLYEGAESCSVITLDDFIETTFSDPTTTFGLKIDTQGFEEKVLAGLSRHGEKIKVVLCEMSVVPLYGGGPTMVELGRFLAQRGFRCVALGPEFEHPVTGELLQIDGVFVRRG